MEICLGVRKPRRADYTKYLGVAVGTLLKLRVGETLGYIKTARAFRTTLLGVFGFITVKRHFTQILSLRNTRVRRNMI